MSLFEQHSLIFLVVDFIYFSCDFMLSYTVIYDIYSFVKYMVIYLCDYFHDFILWDEFFGVLFMF